MSTFMYPDHISITRPNNPTATVIVNGLALLCFSRANNRAEVGLLPTDNTHPLFITVYNPDCNGIAKDINGDEFNY